MSDDLRFNYLADSIHHDLYPQVDQLRKSIQKCRLSILEIDKKIADKIADMEMQQVKDRSDILLARVNHRLSQRISDLETKIECQDENIVALRQEKEGLRDSVSTINQKLTTLSTQITELFAKVDELENDSIVNDYLVNQRVDHTQDNIGELQVMVFPTHLTEYPQ